MGIFNHKYRFAIFVLLLINSTISFSQNEMVKVTGESLKNLVRDGQQVFRYLKNVNILHEGAVMTCDSAYVYRKTNSVEAYGQIVVIKEDSKLYGDFLQYDGNSSSGMVSGKEVKLVQKDATLVTDAIYFNTKNNSAYYLTKGTLTNPENKMISQHGYYYSKLKRYNFAGKVEMEGKDGRIFTDSLEYDTQQEVVSFYGPTRIYNKENYVYCEKGWYNRRNGESNFFTNAFMQNKANKVFGEDIFYDKEKGFTRIIDKVAIVDTTNKVTVFGGKASYWDIEKRAIVEENPLLMTVSEGDTLFLRSDKMLLNSYPDKSLPDSVYRIVRAVGKVAYYKKDLQGRCDSIIYSTKDSTASFFVEPVLWSDNNQMTADVIKAYSSKDNKVRRMDFDGNAFSVAKEDSIHYNQIRGKSMIAYFSNGQFSRLDVKGNGQAVYYLRDEGVIAAVNKAESSDLTAFFKNRKPSRISFKVKPISTFYPIEKIDYEEVTLKGFRWLDNLRPKSKFDITPKGLDLTLTDAKPWFKRDVESNYTDINKKP